MVQLNNGASTTLANTGQTDRQTDGHHQTDALPRSAMDAIIQFQLI